MVAAMAASLSEQNQMYFFSRRERKYPNGNRPNRAAGCGYWKATGTDKPIFNSDRTLKLGVKKALVFYKGRPPKGTKTNWIMHEYRLLNGNESAQSQAKKSLKQQLDDWVLCLVYTRIGQSSMIRSSEILREVKEDKGITNQGSPLAVNRIGSPRNVETLEGLTRMGDAPLFDHYPRSNTLYMGQINEENPTSSISLSDPMVSLDSDCSWNINDNCMSARSEKPSALSDDPHHVHHSVRMLDRKNTFETKYYSQYVTFLSSISTRRDSINSPPSFNK